VSAKQYLEKAVASGLTEDSLHPLELDAYRQVRDALKVS
jgi:hypothetical protein